MCYIGLFCILCSKNCFLMSRWTPRPKILIGWLANSVFLYIYTLSNQPSGGIPLEKGLALGNAQQKNSVINPWSKIYSGKVLPSYYVNPLLISKSQEFAQANLTGLRPIPFVILTKHHYSLNFLFLISFTLALVLKYYFCY